MKENGSKDLRFEFEWNQAKAAANFRKHGVTFELASSVFGDPRILTVADTEHSEQEERWFSIGLTGTGVLLAVAYVWTEPADGPVKIRLISARKATTSERIYYTERT